jgi:corrinoid protein of di/trimethylamine methyltransferase
MATKSALIEALQGSIMEGDKERARVAARQALDAGIPPLEAIERGLNEGLRIIGEKFGRLEVYLPDLMLGANAFGAAMEILEPAILEAGQRREPVGRVVIGTVKGDIHRIGKDIVAMLLKAAGFEVHDLGVDVPSAAFLTEAAKVKADIIAMSSLLTSTMPGQREVIALLKEKGQRDHFAIMVGGGPVTQDWSDQIGANVYGKTAAEAVQLALKLMDR